jgi:hypothetical protein
MRVPKLQKIVLSQGMGEAVADKKLIESAVADLSRIAGQKAVTTISKKDISNFKLRKGMPIGTKVTLRGENLDFPSYLVFKKVEEKWLIVQESDLVTDGNLSRNKTSGNVPKDAVSGDFNGDGKTEYMWLVPPKLIENDMNCEGNCTSIIQFSDNSIPAIKVEDCIDGLPVNEGDLNNNGADEIGLLPGWFTSCWHSYLVWTIKNGSWVYAVDPISTHCNQWDEGVDAIEKDRKKDGYVIVRYSDISDADFVVLSKSVKIN